MSIRRDAVLKCIYSILVLVEILIHRQGRLKYNYRVDVIESACVHNYVCVCFFFSETNDIVAY